MWETKVLHTSRYSLHTCLSTMQSLAHDIWSEDSRTAMQLAMSESLHPGRKLSWTSLWRCLGCCSCMSRGGCKSSVCRRRELRPMSKKKREILHWVLVCTWCYSFCSRGSWWARCGLYSEFLHFECAQHQLWWHVGSQGHN